MQSFPQLGRNNALWLTKGFLKTELLHPLEPRGRDSPVRRYALPKSHSLMEHKRLPQPWGLGHSQKHPEAVLTTPARPKSELSGVSGTFHE